MINLRNPGQFLAALAFCLVVAGLCCVASGIGIIFGEGSGYIATGVVLAAAGTSVGVACKRLYREMGGGSDGEGE